MEWRRWIGEVEWGRGRGRDEVEQGGVGGGEG